MRRRDFVKLTGATLLCACVGGLGASGCAPRTSNVPMATPGSYTRLGNLVKLSLAASGLRALGSALLVPLEDVGDDEDLPTGILVLHLGDNVYRAFANRCTHRGRELHYDHERHTLECVSGKARFDLSGRVLAGPAERPLVGYPCRLAGDDLQIEL